LQTDWAEELANYLNEKLKRQACGVYHARMENKEQQGALNDWKDGKLRFLIATSALGAGMDYRHVRLVMHQGQSRNLIEFGQKSGRGGRDGKPAQSIVFFWEGIKRMTEWIKDEGKEKMIDWVKSSECRKKGLSIYLHGSGDDCLSQSEGEICNNCEKKMTKDLIWNIKMRQGQKRGRDIEYMEIKDGTDLREMINELKEKCTRCWIDRRKEEIRGYELLKCKYNGVVRDCESVTRYVWMFCLRCQSGKHGMNDCMKVNYRKGSCCTSCGFPQQLFSENIHGNVETGECEKGLRDLIKRGCWRVFRDDKLREKYLENSGIEMETEEDYMKWLVRLYESGDMINGCRLMLMIWRKMEE